MKTKILNWIILILDKQGRTDPRFKGQKIHTSVYSLFFSILKACAKILQLPSLANIRSQIWPTQLLSENEKPFSDADAYGHGG